MSFIKSMQERYTTKKYDQTKKISSEKIEELKEILRLSPSSVNSQPWKFIFVTDQEIRNKLAKVSMHNAAKVENCDTVIVFSRIDNLELFENQLKVSPHPIAFEYYKNLASTQSVEQIKAWLDRQVYLALGVLLSACAEMKIDSTPMEGIEPEEYDKILGLKDYHAIVAVAIGYRDVEDKNQLSVKAKSRRTFEEVIETI
jgi:nitroreductase/dihydropteridine reductase